ncbi:MAG: response regulator transcription factor, partial [bacterium]|nr:response regulator transcription factor [bacterium]
ICISQLRELDHRIKGLEKGADDYIPKPFSPAELWLKISKWLHVQKRKQYQLLNIGPIEFIADTGVLLDRDKQKTLRRREASILACLLRYKNAVVSRDTIIDTVWRMSDEPPTFSTLDVYIRRLRIALGEHHRLIKTVRGFGYMITDKAVTAP